MNRAHSAKDQGAPQGVSLEIPLTKIRLDLLADSVESISI